MLYVLLIAFAKLDRKTDEKKSPLCLPETRKCRLTVVVFVFLSLLPPWSAALKRWRAFLADRQIKISLANNC